MTLGKRGDWRGSILWVGLGGGERKMLGAKAQQWKDRTKGRGRLIWLAWSLCGEIMLKIAF